jgi:hypothetical protein
MAKSYGFGSNLYNYNALLILNFFTPYGLLYKLTCWTLLQKVRYYIVDALTACKLKISVSFQSLLGFFCTFGFRYSFTIG